jgi:hypothetical protein
MSAASFTDRDFFIVLLADITTRRVRRSNHQAGLIEERNPPLTADTKW